MRGVAFMESIVLPFTSDSMGPVSRSVFSILKVSGLGDLLILRFNAFVDFILPFTILRPLSLTEKLEYRKPFANAGEDRRPTLTWPRLMPVNGHPADMVDIVGAYAEFMSKSTFPKLWINAEPGAIVRLPGARDFVRSWRNLKEETVAGSHFIQEDSPYEIAEHVRRWITTIP